MAPDLRAAAAALVAASKEGPALLRRHNEDHKGAMQVSAACCAGLRDLLAAHPRAAAATLLVGSNDVLASLNSQVPPAVRLFGRMSTKSACVCGCLRVTRRLST